MGSTLRKLEKELRSYAKRVKGVTYTSALLISFLLTGMISLSATTQTDKAITQTKNDIVDTTAQVKQAFINAKRDNDRLIKNSNLELIKLMEQGDQVVKSPWSSWQYGINYFHNKWNGTYKGKGDKAQKYPYEGEFVRSKDPYERSISPNSSSYKNFTALKESENRGKNPLTSAITSVREKGGKQLNSYGVTSTERVQEPIASLNVDATVRPKEVGRKPVSVDEIKTKVPEEVNVVLNVPAVQAPDTITPKEIKVTVKTPQPSTNPFMDFYTSTNEGYEKVEEKTYSALNSNTGVENDGVRGAVYSGYTEKKHVNVNNNTDNGFKNKILYSGHNGTNYIAESGRIDNNGNKANFDSGTNRRAMLVYLKSPYLIGNKVLANGSSGARIDASEDQKISEIDNRVGGYLYGGSDNDANKKIFHLAGNVDVAGKRRGQGNGEGEVGIHSVWNGTIQNVEGNLYGKAAMFSIESWHAPKIVFNDVKVNLLGDKNTIFYFAPADESFLLNDTGKNYNASIQRGAFLGKGVNVDAKTNENIVYSVVGSSGSFNYTNNANINFEGANNIFYSGLGYSPNMKKLINGTFIKDFYNTGMTPLINMKKAVNSYGDGNTILLFADLIPDNSTGIDINGDKIDGNLYPKTTTTWSTNTPNLTTTWRNTKIGIFQGEVRAAARIGEKLNIDGGDSQTEKGNTTSNKWVENNVGILAQSGQREGIEPKKDLLGNDNKFKDVNNDAIHPLYVNDIDVTFGKYSKRNIMIDSERGTQIDVAKSTNSSTAGAENGIAIRTESIKDYNMESKDYKDENKLVSSADDTKNKAATGTILALAKGTWGDGEAKQRRLATGNNPLTPDYGISVDTINALKDEQSEINFGVPLEMSAKMAKEKVEDKDVELRPIAYMAEGGKITAKDTKAYGFGSIIAYANKFEHNYKDDTGKAHTTVSYGDIHIDGNIEAVDGWAADDAATKLEKYNNIGAYASGKGGSGKDATGPEKTSTVVITGNANIHGTAAYATNGGEVEIKGTNSDIKAGVGSGLVALKSDTTAKFGGTVKFGGGTIEVKNNFDDKTKYDKTAPVYADKYSVIEIKGDTTFNLYDGVIDLADVNDYKPNGKYRGFKEHVTLNIKKDGINLGQIDNTGSTMVWNGTDDYVKSLLVNTDNGGAKRLFKAATAQKDNGQGYFWTKSYITGGILNVEPKAPATTLNISINDENDGYNHISLRKTLVDIKDGVTITKDASNPTTAQGLSINSDASATSNDETGFVNSGIVKVENGVLTSSNSTAAMSVNYGKIENKNKVEMTNAGVGIFGTNGSKLVNDTKGSITIAEKGIGIAANASSINPGTTALVTFGTDKAGVTGNAVDILNAGKIEIKGKNSIGISVKNNSDKDRSKLLVKNIGNITLGDNGAGISVKSENPSATNQGATIELAGNITVGKEGIGTYAQDSDVKLTDNLTVNVKDSGVGIYLKDKSTINLAGGVTDKKLILNYKGSNTGKATGVIFDGNDLVNNINVEINNETNTKGGLTNLLANGTGSFTNKGTIKTVGVKGYGIVANKNTLTSVVNEGDIKVLAADKDDNPNIGIYAKEAATAITNKGNITVDKNSIGIYGHGVTLETGAKIETSDNAVGIYSNSKDVILKAGSILNVGPNGAVGIYADGGGQNINLLGKISIGDGGYGLINNNKQGNNTIVSSATLTKDLGTDTVFIYSKDKLGSVENHTNLKATGDENYGIYGAGKVDNYGNIDFKAGKANVGIYSTSDDKNNVATNHQGATIEVGASIYDKTKPKDAKYAIGMAGGYTPARDDKNKDGSPKTPLTGHIVNEGIIKVTGEHSIGMFATEKDSTLVNKGDIILSASNTTGIYLDNKAEGHNYGKILSEGVGLENLVGIIVKNGASIENHPGAEIRLSAKNSKGIYQAGSKKGIIKNYGNFVISADKKEASFAGAKISVQGEGSSAFDQNKSKLDKELGGVKLDKDGIYDKRLPNEKPIKAPNLVTVDPKTIERLEKDKLVTPSETAKTVNSLGMYIDTSNVNFTKPIEGIQNLRDLTEVDLIVGNEAAKYTNSKYIRVDPKIYNEKNGGTKSYNDLIIDNPQIAKWSIYSGSLTWMTTIKQNEDTGAIENIYLAKIPYTVWAGNKATPVESTDTYNFLDGLEKRYGVDKQVGDRGYREKLLFNKLNGIGNNEEILFHQAVDEMMGHQYANTQIRTYMTGRQLDKEFRYLMTDWYNPSKQNNKIKVFGMTDEFKTDTAGIKDFTSNSYGVAYVHEDETIKLGQETGWYAGAIYNKFRFKDIGKSVEEQNMLKLGVFKTRAYDDNGSLKWKVSLDGFVGMNDMDRRYLVVDRGMDKNVDEIFGATSRYYTYGIGVRNEVSKDYRLSEHVSLVPYGSLNVEYGRFTTIKEKKGEMRLEVKGNHYISVKPEVGAELKFSKKINSEFKYTLSAGIGYETELGRVYNSRNKAKVAYTDAKLYNLTREKEDRIGSFKADLKFGLEKNRFGLTLNVGYDTRGNNLRGGIGLRSVF